jgi:hypothetical protein
MFGAPIPGESLTREPGSTPWERPPQYVDLNEAAEDIFDKIVKNSQEIALSLQAGASAESLAKVILFGGFTRGKYNPDLALLLAPIVVAMVAAVGHKMGVKGMKLRNPNKKREQNLKTLYGIASSRTPMEQPMEMVDIAPEEVDIAAEIKMGGFL